MQNITTLLMSWSKPDGTYESPYKETSSSAGIGSWNFAVATNTLVRVYQKYKTVPGNEALIQSIEETVVRQLNSPQVEIKGYYDDEGWWCLAWLEAHLVMGDVVPSSSGETADFLGKATKLYLSMASAWSPACGGGLIWNATSWGSSQKNAVTNLLFVAASAIFANLTPDTMYNGKTPGEWAALTWTWFTKTLMEDGGQINDHVDASQGCLVTKDQWSYNYGICLKACLSLIQMKSPTVPIDSVKATMDKVAATALTVFVKDSIITEVNCANSSCYAVGSGGEVQTDPDQWQFKGLLARYLAEAFPSLQIPSASTPLLTQPIKSILYASALSCYKTNMDPDYVFGSSWQGLNQSHTRGVISTTSALDLFLASLQVGNKAVGPQDCAPCPIVPCPQDRPYRLPLILVASIGGVLLILLLVLVIYFGLHKGSKAFHRTEV